MSEMDDTWRTPIDIVRAQVEKWDATGRLPAPVMGPEGEELLSSKLRRIIFAAANEREQIKPRTGPFRAKTLDEEPPAMRDYLIECRKELARREGKLYSGPVAEARTVAVWQRDVELYNREQDERVHLETPIALKRMGLEAQEISLLGGLDRTWGAVQAVEQFMASPTRRFLVLGGETGTGKTIAAASGLLSCIEELRSDPGQGPVRISKRWTGRGAFFKASDLVRVQNFGKEAEKDWSRLHRIQLLVVDDLGAEGMTDWWRDSFGQLIDARMRREQKTILTTNLKGSELKERYGARVMRRLSDEGVFAKAVLPTSPPNAS